MFKTTTKQLKSFVRGRWLALLRLLIRRPIRPEMRLSSYPLLSGDTFALMADTYPFGHGTFLPTKLSRGRSRLWFVEVSTLEDEEKREHLTQLAQLYGSQSVLIIHNGDDSLGYDYLVRLSQYFVRIYAVNVVTETENIRSLPIGVENQWINSPFELLTYVNETKNFDQSNTFGRSIHIFASFNPGTNRKTREPLINLLADRQIKNQNGLTRAQYRDLLRKSLFVLSPPGNGLDCHRTWEALYCGAVPVVLKGSLSDQLVNNLPIMSVDRWEEILDLDETELFEKYSVLMQRDRSLIFANYWIEEIYRILDVRNE